MRRFGQVLCVFKASSYILTNSLMVSIIATNAQDCKSILFKSHYTIDSGDISDICMTSENHN
jgi:hypothetical protein